MAGQVSEDGDRDRLRRTFDASAEGYHTARPDYPDRLFDDLVRLATLSPGASVLEIGCGTGKATIPMARRGHRVTCLELGERLARQALKNLAEFPDVRVITGSFDDWHPQGQLYDLVYAATAWHWLEPATRYTRAWEALSPGGHLAFWSALHVFPRDGDPFFRDLQSVYDEIGEGRPTDSASPRPGELPDQAEEIEESGLFRSPEVLQYDWEVRYDAESYIALLRTFSGHIAMAEWQQERLFEAIRARVAQRPERVVRRHWGAALHVAQALP
ncbi:class I SAM-dependent methyltransferase [soil metagenome]